MHPRCWALFCALSEQVKPEYVEEAASLLKKSIIPVEGDTEFEKSANEAFDDNDAGIVCGSLFDHSSAVGSMKRWLRSAGRSVGGRERGRGRDVRKFYNMHGWWSGWSTSSVTLRVVKGKMCYPAYYLSQLPLFLRSMLSVLSALSTLLIWFPRTCHFLLPIICPQLCLLSSVASLMLNVLWIKKMDEVCGLSEGGGQKFSISMLRNLHISCMLNAICTKMIFSNFPHLPYNSTLREVTITAWPVSNQWVVAQLGFLRGFCCSTVDRRGSLVGIYRGGWFFCRPHVCACTTLHTQNAFQILRTVCSSSLKMVVVMEWWRWRRTSVAQAANMPSPFAIWG